MKFIKKLIPTKVKVYLHNNYQDYKLNKYYNSIQEEKRFFVIGSPNHGNLGDHAIMLAQKNFLQDRYSGYEVIEVDILEYYNHLKFLKKVIKNSDLIFIQGGGNFGNQYLKDENIRRSIVENFPNNELIMFPQTMYFTNDEEGKKELQKSIDIYSKHKNLTLIAREEVSFDLMIQNFKNNKIVLTPDIVLYLNKEKSSCERVEALFCMRSDLESKFSQDEKDKAFKFLENNYKDIKVTDTVIYRDVSKVERESILESKFNEFRKAKIVITDRIHGMVFAAITGTPCIALSNYNQKVKGTYKWIKYLDYIKFIDSIDDIPGKIEELNSYDIYKYNNEMLNEEYKKIIKIIDKSLKVSRDKI